MQEFSTEELVRRTLAGDKDAFVVLVNSVVRVVFGLARQHVPPSDVEDVAQEAFLRAYRDLAKLKNPAQFKSWVCGIAVRVGQETARSGKRATTVPAQSPDVPAGEDPASEKMVRLMAGLPEKYRVPLTMHYAGHMKYGDIALELGENESTVRSLVHRGRAMLREQWNKES